MSNRGTKVHEVISPRNASPVINHHAARALVYRQRAIELADAARHEDNKSQRRFLLDKAHGMIAVADALDPPPPADEAPVFSK